MATINQGFGFFLLAFVSKGRIDKCRLLGLKVLRFICQRLFEMLCVLSANAFCQVAFKASIESGRKETSKLVSHSLGFHLKVSVSGA